MWATVIVVRPSAATTVTPTATPPPGICEFIPAPIGGSDGSRIELNVAALPLPLTFPLSGSSTVACGALDGNNTAPCTCDIVAINAISIPSIGFICLSPAEDPCPPGRIDCAGGSPLGIDVRADGNIGACDGVAACDAACDQYCADQGAVRLSSGCTGFCSAGAMQPCTTDDDCLPKCSEKSCSLTEEQACTVDGDCSSGETCATRACGSDADCLAGTCGLPGNGSCNGPDPVGARGGICQCQCIDVAAGDPARPGDLQCNLGSSLLVEDAAPCGDGDVKITVGSSCIPFTTATASGLLTGANFMPGSQLPAAGPASNTGVPADCSALPNDALGALKLRGVVAFFGSALGDVVTELFVECGPGAPPVPTPTATRTPTPMPGSGERVFCLDPGVLLADPSGSRTGLFTSGLGGANAATGFSGGPLRLVLGPPGPDGVADFRLEEDVTLDIGIVDGSRFCLKLDGDGSYGTIDCDGGTAYDISATRPAGAPGIAFTFETGLGSPAGPGNGDLVIPALLQIVPVGNATPCQDVVYTNPEQAFAFTTTKGTATITGTTLSFFVTGEPFDCDNFETPNSGGMLVAPLPANQPPVGDVVNALRVSENGACVPTQTPARTRTPTRTRTATPATPPPTIPEAGSCEFIPAPIGSANGSHIELDIAALPVPLTFPLSGSSNVTCSAPGPDNTAPCTCDLVDIRAINIPSIGFVCMVPTPCPPGQIDCDGGSPLGIDVRADGNIGACDGIAACDDACNASCAGQGAAQLSSGCTGFCSAGTMQPCTTDDDCLPKCSDTTCSVTTEQACTVDADCPLGETCINRPCGSNSDCLAGTCGLPGNGSCNGPDPIGNKGGICQCQCINDAAGGPSRPGDLQCNLGVGLVVEDAAPCGDGDVKITVGSSCMPLTTATVTSLITDANFIPGSQLPAAGPVSNSGEPADCATLQSGALGGLELRGVANFFGSALGDVVTELFIDCGGGVPPPPTPTPLSPTSPTAVRTPTRTATAAAVSIVVGSVQGSPGEQVHFAVTLQNGGREVVAVENNLHFDRANVWIPARPDGRPECTVNPNIGKDDTAFIFLPIGCTGASCTGVRTILLSFQDASPIPDGATLYTCAAVIRFFAEPGEYPLVISGTAASDAAGAYVPAGGVNGAVIVGGASARVALGSGTGVPNGEVTVPVMLHTEGAEVAGVRVDLAFDRDTPVAAAPDGSPLCTVNPAIHKNGTSFAFQPLGCTPGTNCDRVRAIVLAFDNSTPIPDGAVLFTCTLRIAQAAESGSHALVCYGAEGSDPAAQGLALGCSGGSVLVGEACLGDCNGSRQTTVDELITGVQLALGNLTVDRCPAFDGNADGEVSIEELVAAVNTALLGCAA